MTKDEFLKKYLGYTVYYSKADTDVWKGYAKSSKTIDTTDGYPGLLYEVKCRMQIESKLFQETEPWERSRSFFLHEGDNPDGQLRLNRSYVCSEFIEDFISFCELSDNVAKETLFINQTWIASELEKINESYDRIDFIGIKSVKEVEETGFINGHTNSKISLWWNINGKRILFARGAGVFELI